ncbi:trk system potassium uptake protein TrkH [Sedimentibacter acidaminivorans]|uniref:Trk system potassium uptake protein TrkH n=1 Tax=Sedimentibacter acidaminivorans TaxID=913099 RepID=A0ABS4GEE4_9FIRM|nr:TrkH family potassium uptake protein [Sedimentibacter acidaminivorans]MBP1926068.1 trk system potassium uptake protein TrkH [Sedimentibacter acidaminivorans]
MFIFKRLKLSYTQIIALGTLVIILIGSILLSFPIASRSGEATPFLNSFFTAASATCVTGLVIYDTYTHWSIFGQIVILSLIQIGGLGFMTIVTLFSMFLRRKIGLRERRLLMESANTMRIGGIVLLIKKISIGTLIFEGIGTILLAIRFCPEMGLKAGIYNALFHSVSAFCNAGFDIMGKYGQFTSLTRYSNDIIVNLTIMILIIIGGIGFLVWDDIAKNRFYFRKYQLHTKIVLTTTVILITCGALLFYILEMNGIFYKKSITEIILGCLFQSVTPRTAGFNTINISNLSESGIFLTMILMIIGGSPGSTAGGIKTTTLVVLIIASISSAMHITDLTIFKKRLEDNALKRASSITVIYMFTALVSTIVICATQTFSLKEVLFEVFSAAGTVGLSLGITPHLNNLSKLIIIFLMYGGKVGSLSMALVLAEKREIVPLSRPVEKIIIG